MSSATSPVRATLKAYLAGRVPAERVVAVVAAAFYRDADGGTRAALGPVMEVVERVAPGAIELGAADGGPGFVLRGAARPFPRGHEPELRRAVEQAVARLSPSAATRPALSPGAGLLGRLVGAVRRLWRAG